MGRFFAYTIIFTMMMVAFQFLGISFLASSGLADLIGFSSSRALDGGIQFNEGNALWVRILTLLAVGVSLGIIVGFFTRSSQENYIVLPFITVIAITFADVIGGILILAGSGVFALTPAFAMILITIMLPIGIGYFITCLEWFRGNI